MTNSGCSRWVRRSRTEKAPRTGGSPANLSAEARIRCGPRQSVVLSGQILILGGSTPRGLTSGILRFDPAQGHYPRGPAPVPNTDGAGAPVGDTGTWPGGLSMAGPLDQIVVIKLRSTQPGPQRGLALWAVMRARCRYVNDVQIRGVCACRTAVRRSRMPMPPGRAVRDGPSWRRAPSAVSPAVPGRRRRGCRGSRRRGRGRRRGRTARRSGSSSG